MKKLLTLAVISGAAIGLSACGGDGSGGTTVVTTPGSSADPNAKYGAKFAADFKASANSDPASVSAGDVVPVDPTADPTPVP